MAIARGLAFRLERALSVGGDAGLSAAADRVKNRSDSDVPVLTGRLLRSGYTERYRGSVRVGYRTPYAAAQHERLDYHHPGGGSAKFLEHALLNEIPHIEAVVAREVAKHLELVVR